MKKYFLFCFFTVLLLGFWCCSKDNNEAPICSITNPQDGQSFRCDEDISITVVAEAGNGSITEVRLYIDNVGHSMKDTFPYNFVINARELQPGSNTLRAVAKDNNGAQAEASIIITMRYKQVGMEYQGGIVIFTFDQCGENGMLVAKEDLSTGIQWWDGSNIVISTSTSMFTGINNTMRIVKKLGDGIYAAKLCYDLPMYGSNSWFLPSADELNLLYLYRDTIGGFDLTADYWSSSSVDRGGFALRQNFKDGSREYIPMGNICKVRAVRYYSPQADNF